MHFLNVGSFVYFLFINIIFAVFSEFLVTFLQNTSQLYSSFLPEPNRMEVELYYYNRRKATDRVKGEMFDKTKALLDSFYRPFNKRLVELLGDGKFLWNDL